MITHSSGNFAFLLRAMGIAALFILVVLSFSPAPKTIPYAHPQAEGKYAEITYDFWGAFQTGSTWAVSDSECGTNHGWPDNNPPVIQRQLSSKDHRFANIICRMEEALEKDETDVQLPNILAAAYSWRASTHVKPAHILRDLHEAKHHAKQAVDNGNVFAAGFQSAPTWYLGFILEGMGYDKEKVMSYKEPAYRQMVESTENFAAFHGFVEGAMLSAMLNPEQPSPDFDYYWAHISYLENLNACVLGDKWAKIIHLPEGMRINDLIMNIVARVSILSGRSYCYNNSTAPFNMPGLYIAQGDAYLKNNKMKLAKIAYENALRSPNAAYWGKADEVRIRLNNMEASRKKFLDDSFKFNVDQKPTAMIGQSEWFCATCHQWSQTELALGQTHP